VPGKLTRQNIEALKSCVPAGTLRQNFRDAAKIALELGLEYIWIDSFCIIQDSAEDWKAESVKMSLVYGNSACNIAATSSSNSSGGCFRPRDEDTPEPVKLTFGKDKKKSDFYLTDVRQWSRRFQKEPLNQRAWVVQERLLSPCNIHYDRNQLVWECNELLASETFPKGLGDLIQTTARPLRVPLDSAYRNTQEDEIPGQALREIWRPIVHLFTSSDITKPTDRLIALHGVGSRIEKVCGWPYVAGMFLKNLQSQLCWAANGDPKLLRPEVSIAPSWSWVSVNQPVQLMPQWELVESDATGEGPKPGDLNEESLCQIQGVERGTSPAEVSGHISSAQLRVSCYMVPAEFLDCNDVRKEFLDKMESKLQELRIENELRFKTRPLFADFTFMKSSQDLDERDSTYKDGPLAHGDVKISWDFWSELSPSTVRDLWFMPVYKVREYRNWQPSTSYAKQYVVHGLILQAGRLEGGRRSFRRCGTFVLDKGWQEFWEHALGFVPIDGVDCVTGNGILFPEKDDKGRYLRRFTKANAVKQYQITIV
jgi:hypothetical protein